MHVKLGWNPTVAIVQTSGSLVPRSGSPALVSLISIFQLFHLLPSPPIPFRENEREGEASCPEFVPRVPRFNIRACRLDIQWTDISM